MSIENENQNFFQENPAKESFLQSQSWRDFQKSFGRDVFYFDEKTLDGNSLKKTNSCFSASIIQHQLPFVGKYLYVPRGPIIGNCNKNNLEKIENFSKALQYLIWLARENNAGWIRIDPQNKKDLNLIFEIAKKISKDEKKVFIKKSPHDMQPQQIFEIDITKSEEELLSQMKPKTRYNIRLAEKKGILVKKISNLPDSLIPNETPKTFFVDEFLRLVKVTSKRQRIAPHGDEYYRKMLEIPGVELYVAEYEGKIIAANIVVFYGQEAIYLHGASDDEYKNLMAPFLLQWQQIKDAKMKGCRWYDFGGVSTKSDANSQIVNFKEMLNAKWKGITRFKLGFSPDTKPFEFPGSYDISVISWRYFIYRILQRLKSYLR